MPLMQMIDVISLITLLAVTAAAIRRVIAPPYPEARTFEAFFILFLIATLMLANFGVNAAKISRMQGSMLEMAKNIMPVSSLFAPYIPQAAGKLVHDLSWWTHAWCCCCS